MWIFLNDAFLSIVAHRDRPDDLLVRARAPGDIEMVFPGAVVLSTPAADYPFRAVVDRRVVAGALLSRVAGIDYDNFKGSVAEDTRHDAYLDVWAMMKLRFNGGYDYACQDDFDS